MHPAISIAAKDLRQKVRDRSAIILSVLAGVTSTSGATVSTPNGSATRVVATIDGSNNRTSMALTPSA